MWSALLLSNLHLLLSISVPSSRGVQSFYSVHVCKDKATLKRTKGPVQPRGRSDSSQQQAERKDRCGTTASSPWQEMVSFSRPPIVLGVEVVLAVATPDVQGCKAVCSDVGICIHQFLLGKGCLGLWETLGFCYRLGSVCVLSTKCK